MKTLIMSFITLSTVVVFAQGGSSTGKEELKKDAQAVNVACQEEAKAAGCEGKEVGKGLLKCVREYRKANKEFKVSDGCKDALKELRAERKKHKAEK